jgi:hypothetical protein
MTAVSQAEDNPKVSHWRIHPIRVSTAVNESKAGQRLTSTGLSIRDNCTPDRAGVIGRFAIARGRRRAW